MRRRKLAPRPITPPVINIGGALVHVDEYKREGCGPAMAAVDSLPPEYRQLVHEMNLEFVWPKRRQSVVAIRQAWERQHGRG